MKLLECLCFSHFKSSYIVKAICQLIRIPFYFLRLLPSHCWIFFDLLYIILYEVKCCLMMGIDWIYSKTYIKWFFHFCKKLIPLILFDYLKSFVIIFKLLIVLPFIYFFLCFRKISVWRFLISLLSFLLFDFSQLIFSLCIWHLRFIFCNYIIIFFFF